MMYVDLNPIRVGINNTLYKGVESVHNGFNSRNMTHALLRTPIKFKNYLPLLKLLRGSFFRSIYRISMYLVDKMSIGAK